MNGQFDTQFDSRFDIGAISPARYFFGMAALLGVLFALVGGGEEDAGLLSRLALWQFQTLLPMLLFVTGHILLLRWHWFETRSQWLQLFTSGVLGVLLFSPFNLALDLWLEGRQVLGGANTAPSVAGMWAEEIGYMAPPAIVCWVALNVPWVMGFRLQRPQPSEAPVSPEPSGSPVSTPADQQSGFLSMLPEPVRGEPSYLKAELHYLLVVTDAGKHLLLYNLKDAIAELPKDQGFMSHRSYWVNRNRVKRLRKRGRQGELELHDGTLIPVSRNRLPAAMDLFSH